MAPGQVDVELQPLDRRRLSEQAPLQVRGPALAAVPPHKRQPLGPVVVGQVAVDVFGRLGDPLEHVRPLRPRRRLVRQGDAVLPEQRRVEHHRLHRQLERQTIHLALVGRSGRDAHDVVQVEAQALEHGRDVLEVALLGQLLEDVVLVEEDVLQRAGGGAGEDGLRRVVPRRLHLHPDPGELGREARQGLLDPLVAHRVVGPVGEVGQRHVALVQARRLAVCPGISQAAAAAPLDTAAAGSTRRRVCPLICPVRPSTLCPSFLTPSVPGGHGASAPAAAVTPDRRPADCRPAYQRNGAGVRTTMPNPVKERLLRGDRALGLSFGFACAPLVEVGALLGFDFTYLDAEHGTISPRECEDLVRAADCRQSPTICRVGTSDPQVMLRYLDTGIAGIQLPHMRTAADVERAVRAVRFHPRRRARPRRRALGRLRPARPSAKVRGAQQRRAPAHRADRGPGRGRAPGRTGGGARRGRLVRRAFDLSQAAGHPGQQDHPEVRALVEGTITKLRDEEKIVGSAAAQPEAANRFFELGRAVRPDQRAAPLRRGGAGLPAGCRRRRRLDQVATALTPATRHRRRHYKEAAARIARLAGRALRRRRPRASIDADDSRYYYKAPYLLALAGLRAKGARVARFVLKHLLDQGRTSPVRTRSAPTSASTAWAG